MNKTKYRFMNLHLASRNLIAKNAKKFVAKNFPFLNMKLTDGNNPPKGVPDENKKIQYFLAARQAPKKESSPFVRQEKRERITMNDVAKLNEQWQDICGQIRSELDDNVLLQWLGQLTPSLTEKGNVCLCVPTRFMKEWMDEKDYASFFTHMWQSRDNSVRSVCFDVVKKDEDAESVSVIEKAESVALPMPKTTFTNNVDPAKTFDTFVVGEPNELAVAAAKKVADMVPTGFNPLFLHSSVGLGKTHLMHAIVQKIESEHPDKKVLYLSAEQFTFQYIQSLRADNPYDFKEMFRSADILLVDDVQFICGKKGTQTEFFHTFNALYEQGKQIVLASDSSPLDLKELDDRLRTRMAQGLIVDIFPTTYEMRLGILQTKAALWNVTLPMDVADFLARHITANVRELEGALKRVIAKAQLLGSPITLDGTKELLKETLENYAQEISVAEIQKAVCDYFTVRLADLKSTRRDRSIARPRQIAMYLVKTLTTKSLPDIGHAFERDHTTIMHAIRTVADLMKKDATLCEDVNRLKKMLGG